MSSPRDAFGATPWFKLMALSYQIVPSRKLVTITGEFSTDVEWRTVLQAVADDPQYQPGFSFLRDLRDATQPIDAQTVRRILEVVQMAWAILQPRRAAIVAPRHVETPALVAYALAEDAGVPLRVFTSYGDAIDWLRSD